ncbi:hypothetical protein JR316_0009858 [Psilocybe cubensis]|uniref:Uncharacterized protein n=2 Tax=Psilocybe cubensis TaxID=181762 RepID=A0A8H8CFC8_PSICU|nr:hypothetical protein JR316_0009858 [Psilocybe cubensis]KAH9477632.1 hypothetical protein JR316_0009858 [Psilocybe cubensis]
MTSINDSPRAHIAWGKFLAKYQYKVSTLSSNHDRSTGRLHSLPPELLESARNEWISDLTKSGCTPYGWPTLPEEIGQLEQVLQWRSSEMWNHLIGLKLGARDSKQQSTFHGSSHHSWTMENEGPMGNTSIHMDATAPTRTEQEDSNLDPSSRVIVFLPRLYGLSPSLFHRIWTSGDESSGLKDYALLKWRALMKEFYSMAKQYGEQVEDLLRKVKNVHDVEKLLLASDHYHQQLADGVYRDWEQAISEWSEGYAEKKGSILNGDIGIMGHDQQNHTKFDISGPQENTQGMETNQRSVSVGSWTASSETTCRGERRSVCLVDTYGDLSSPSSSALSTFLSNTNDIFTSKTFSMPSNSRHRSDSQSDLSARATNQHEEDPQDFVLPPDISAEIEAAYAQAGKLHAEKVRMMDDVYCRMEEGRISVSWNTENYEDLLGQSYDTVLETTESDMQDPTEEDEWDESNTSTPVPGSPALSSTHLEKNWSLSPLLSELNPLDTMPMNSPWTASPKVREQNGGRVEFLGRPNQKLTCLSDGRVGH